MGISSHLIALGFFVGSSVASAQYNNAPKTINDRRSLSPIAQKFANWTSITTPADGEAKIYGNTNGGCLVGARPLNMNSGNYTVLLPTENRIWGHPQTINYINELGARLRAEGLPKMLVEDVSGPRGGPKPFGHNSHQTGLDIDISLDMPEPELTADQRNTHITQSYVSTSRTLMRPKWRDDRQGILIARAADSPDVERIFVAPVIKQYFCEKYPNAPWLHKLRAWDGHEDHMHIRLNCPQGSPACKSIAGRANPNDKQCGASLAAKARSWKPNGPEIPWEKYSGEPTVKYPNMPSACESVRAAKGVVVTATSDPAPSQLERVRETQAARPQGAKPAAAKPEMMNSEPEGGQRVIAPNNKDDDGETRPMVNPRPIQSVQ